MTKTLAPYSLSEIYTQRLDDIGQRYYRQCRKAGDTASLSYHRATTARIAERFSASLEWEDIESAYYGERAILQCESFAVSIEYHSDDDGLIPHGIETEPELLTYYRDNVEWMGYVIEVFDTDGNLLAEDSCWGREVNFPGSLTQYRDAMSEWVAAERCLIGTAAGDLVTYRQGETILEAVIARAQTEQTERADAAARGILTVG